MRHRNRGKKLGVKPAHRSAMKRNMVKSLVDNERVITTIDKAKAFRPFADKIIHLSKEKNLHNIRQVVKLLGNRDLQMEFVDDDNDTSKAKIKTVVQKLFDDIGPRNRTRNGGYTRILRLAKRRLGDAGERCIFELVEGGLTQSLSASDAAPASASAGSAPVGAGA
jgi:large subunit ribosomal protein L17